MISFGCNTLPTRRYEDDVHFARLNGFDFLQVGYAADGFLYMHEQDAPYPETLMRAAFPVTIHSLLRVSEFDEHLPRLLQALQALGSRELIIHPISETREPGSTTLSELIEGIRKALTLFLPHGISLYLENNSSIDTLFSTPEDIEEVFTTYPNLEFLLDVAHVKDYTTLSQMVDVKMPKILHISDRHANVAHEHLPIGHGDIDFMCIMAGPLRQFRGKVIFEVPVTDPDRVSARQLAGNWMKTT